MPNVITIDLGLKHVDLRCRASHKGSVRACGAGVSLALARACAETLAREVGEFTVFAFVAVRVCAWGCGRCVGLVREGSDVACVLWRVDC